MSDMVKVFFSGVEEFARKMKEHSSSGPGRGSVDQELIGKVDALTDKVDKLLKLLESNQGRSIVAKPSKGKRMMDIKKRINEIIAKHPGGIRPPQIAGILVTKVQNLYPHLKAAVANKMIIKDKTGSYLPAKPKAKTGAGKK
ncbi:MAG: hypothetical protein U9P14_11445 [Gemmatimonadota bacterium]|nr:hypothetical protein [Gemmatimonadota bacterium]